MAAQPRGPGGDAIACGVHQRLAPRAQGGDKGGKGRIAQKTAVEHKAAGRVQPISAGKGQQGGVDHRQRMAFGGGLLWWSDKAALAPEGPEYAALARIAQDNDVFLSGNAYETDQAFAGLYFQASFVIDPSGQNVLRYRRLVSMFAPTPHDVWDRYLELYGLDGVFPVADTAIGRLRGGR